jgi:hypothetical protein
MNNRLLLIIFASGLLLFFAGKFFRGTRTASFDPVITTVDTNMVDHIKFISGGTLKEEFELRRSGETWEAVKGNNKVVADNAKVSSLLSPLSHLNANRVVTKDTSKYAEYEITDKQAGRVTIWEGDEQVADIIVGGFRFDQATRSASSYIRKSDGPEVYVIDGFAGMGLKARFDQFRNKQLLSVNSEDVTRLEWSNAAGNRQVLQKEEGAWYYAGMEALDSTRFDAFLSALVAAQGTSFSDLSTTEGLTVAEQLTITGNNMSQPTIISAYIQADTLSPFLIHSTFNPMSIFNSDSTGLYKRVFADLRQFWPDGK